jgi:hypothetical protein
MQQHGQTRQWNLSVTAALDFAPVIMSMVRTSALPLPITLYAVDHAASSTLTASAMGIASSLPCKQQPAP